MRAAGALEVLKRPPFPPRDLSFFARSFFPEAPDESPPTAAITEGQAKTLLMDTLGRRPALTAAQVTATIALFDDAALKQTVPSPGLRAGLLLNRGTAGDAAIQAITGGAFARITFANAPAFFGDTAAWVESIAGRSTINVASWVEGEDPRVVAPVLAHETLHSDNDVQSKEEAICAAIEAIIYGQLVLESPDIATARTRLSRYNNTRLLERLNGRDETGKLRLLYASGFTLPRSQVGFGSFVEYYQPFFARPTAGNPTLSAMVAAVTGRPSSAGFENALVEQLDTQQAALRPEDLVRLADILALDTNPAPAPPVPDRPRSTLPVPTPPPATPAELAAQQILRQPAFTPRTPALLDPGLYQGSPAGSFAGPPGLDATAARALLQETLARRFGAADARTTATLAAFDGQPLTGAVPEPTLRAALLSLRGTAADTVIEAVTTGVFAGLTFTEPVADLPRATVLPPTPPARPRLAVNALLRFEDPRLIAPWIAEAALHEDALRTPKESLVGQALLPLIHGQLLLETPALARLGTLLARQLNGLLFGRLNSRDAEGRLRLTASRGNIFPGSVTNIGSFLGVFIPFGPDTPGGRTLWDVVSAVTGEGTFQGTFSVTTIRLLEDRQTLWSAEQIVTLLRVLEANLP